EPALHSPPRFPIWWHNLSGQHLRLHNSSSLHIIILSLFSSFISISDLQCQQRTPCCSHMTWSTSDFKKWAHQGEVILPKQSVLPRTHLILIGYLTDGRRQEGKEKLMDGNLYVQDSTGSIPCELLHFESEWLELLFLFPSWAYIPQTSQGSAGYVEILADPVPVDPRPERVVDTIPVFYPATAAQLLTVATAICHRFTLHHSKNLACSGRSWHHMLQLGHGYVLTALSVSGLKASGHKVFVTSFSSCLLPYSAEQVKEQPLEIAWRGGPIQPVSPEATVQLPLELTDEKLPVPAKESKILSYMVRSYPSPAPYSCFQNHVPLNFSSCPAGPMGTVCTMGSHFPPGPVPSSLFVNSLLFSVLLLQGIITRVLNAQAGLYELDNKICLCLAYQQLLNSARGLRPGACVEVR
uniref:CST complex subunit CTC1 n=1 Tax=Gopherus agassizii TaxID=38772 RepID=A0A452IJN4_9SAUR